MKIAVVGASGFVGSVVSEVLRAEGHEVEEVRAPRVAASLLESDVVLDPSMVGQFVHLLGGVQVVVNCSGNPDASERDLNALIAANAVSPAIVARACRLSGVGRLVHLSSAVVQGRRPRLDESDVTDEFSSYARSKAEGERRVRHEFEGAVVYRPPSVHADGRRVTSMTARIARSPFATVAFPGDQPSPQALIGNVASAIAYLATTAHKPPEIVMHPWEGLSAVDVMELLGAKQPFVIPRRFARFICRGLGMVGRRVPVIAANARRVEMLWFGQEQGESWLSAAGWTPPLGRDAWRELGEAVKT